MTIEQGLQGAGIGAGLAMQGINTIMQQRLAQDNMRLNYSLNEKAADNADLRQRQQWVDMYSIKAQLKQMQENGLSPSLMYGGTPTQGGASAPQGAGTAGSQIPFQPFNMLEAAEVAKTLAETKKVKAETSNIDQDTALKQIETNMAEMQKNLYSVEFDITTTFVDMDGEPVSFYDFAKYYDDFDAYYSAMKRIAAKSDPEMEKKLSSEAGNKVMRGIFLARKEFSKDIALLSSQEVDAKFQESVTSAMNNSDFAQMNAQAAVAYLKANIATSELTAQQKDAWNNLLSKLGEKNATLRDIVIVLGMIVNTAMSNWSLPQSKTYNFTNNNNNGK